MEDPGHLLDVVRMALLTILGHRLRRNLGSGSERFGRICRCWRYRCKVENESAGDDLEGSRRYTRWAGRQTALAYHQADSEQRIW